jgi:hypothetical protein
MTLPTSQARHTIRLPKQTSSAGKPALPSALCFGLLLAAGLTLSGCGGSSSSSPPSATTPDPTPVAVDPLAPATPSDLDKVAALYGIETSGIGGDAAGDGGAAGAAGDGAPLKAATVTLTDAKGNTVSGTTDSNGKFLLKYKTANFTAPLVLRVTDAGGNVLSSVTDESATTGKAIRASINPLTDKVASDVIPANISGTDKTFDGSQVDLAKLAKAKADITTSIKDALTTAGVADSSKFDPVKSVYNYDGTGVDAIIESISHSRDPATGATQLRAKLAALQTNADGSVTPSLISASTPLATTQVALASSPTLTFGKLTAWIDEINRCLALSAAANDADANCQDTDGSRIVAQGFKNNSKDLRREFDLLFSETGNTIITGSKLSNPTVLFVAAQVASVGGVTVASDTAVVEVTIDQPRTGALSGNFASPIRYTKLLTFKRDDSLKTAKAGNWILFGNQRNFDWGVDPQYVAFTEINPTRQANAGVGQPSEIRSRIRLAFGVNVFNPATNQFVKSNVYALRVTGPGLPAAGVVYAPYNSNGNLAILNKTGVIPAQGARTAFSTPSFSMGGALLGSGLPLDSAVWARSPASDPQAYADTSNGTDFSKTQAYTQYKAEIYVNGTTQPIVETARIHAPIQAPAAMAKLPLLDLRANADLITPPKPAASSITVQWTRVPGTSRLENAGTYDTPISYPGTNLPDRFAVNPTSTSVVITNGTAGFTASTVFDYRDISVGGSAGRALFAYVLRRTGDVGFFSTATSSTNTATTTTVNVFDASDAVPIKLSSTTTLAQSFYPVNTRTSDPATRTQTLYPSAQRAVIRNGSVFVITSIKGQIPVDVQFSSLTTACAWQDQFEVDTLGTDTWYRVSEAGPDGLCDTADDRQAMVRTTGSATSPPIFLPVGMNTIQRLPRPDFSLGFLLANDTSATPPKLVLYSPSMALVGNVTNGTSGSTVSVAGAYDNPGQMSYLRVDNSLQRITWDDTGAILSQVPSFTYSSADPIGFGLVDGNDFYFVDGAALWKMTGFNAPTLLSSDAVAPGGSGSSVYGTPTQLVVSNQFGTSGTLRSVSKAGGPSRSLPSLFTFGINGEQIYYFTAFGAGQLRRVNADGSGDIQLQARIQRAGFESEPRTAWENFGAFTSKAAYYCTIAAAATDCNGGTLVQLDIASNTTTTLGVLPTLAGFTGVRPSVQGAYANDGVLSIRVSGTKSGINQQDAYFVKSGVPNSLVRLTNVMQ